MKPISKIIVALIFNIQFIIVPVTSATGESAITQMIADWVATQSAQEVIDQCNEVINGQGYFASLSVTELQVVLNGQSCEAFIASVTMP